MSTGQGLTGTQAPINQQLSQEGFQLGIPPSVSNDPEIARNTQGETRNIVDDGGEDNDEDDYYSGEMGQDGEPSRGTRNPNEVRFQSTLFAPPDRSSPPPTFVNRRFNSSNFASSNTFSFGQNTLRPPNVGFTLPTFPATSAGGAGLSSFHAPIP